jgi:hypothetical protein
MNTKASSRSAATGAPAMNCSLQCGFRALHVAYPSRMPVQMDTWLQVTRVPRRWEGDSSAMNMGTVDENTPMAIPVSTRPAAREEKPEAE